MPKPKRRPAQSPHEIHRTLVLSTGHITKKDSDLLDAERAPLVVFQKVVGSGTAHFEAYGYWVQVPDAQMVRDGGMSPTAIRRAGYSKAFRGLLDLARRLDCQWIMLDRDGVLYPDLPRFDW